jgi:hypothetical protein
MPKGHKGVGVSRYKEVAKDQAVTNLKARARFHGKDVKITNIVPEVLEVKHVKKRGKNRVVPTKWKIEAYGKFVNRSE